ncbi:MFS transporter [Streptomyces sp. AK08-01B]|nr:MFS transporter [Streptomyces sp. AK08-01B]MDX3820619.1 MFS transporter [Streptomyces sp. AK08-01A]
MPDTEGRRAHRAGPLRVLVVWPFGVLSARDHQEVGAGRHPDGQRASVRSRLERQPWAAPRLRTGALHWDLYQDAARPDTYLEVFLVASWIDRRCRAAD